MRMLVPWTFTHKNSFASFVFLDLMPFIFQVRQTLNGIFLASFFFILFLFLPQETHHGQVNRHFLYSLTSLQLTCTI